MSDFDLELKNCFLEEAKELLTDTETLFLELEQTENQKEVIQQIFRVVHTLKGSSAATGFSDLSKFAHKLESLMTSIKDGQISLTPDVMELLLSSNDLLSHFVNALSLDHNTYVEYSELYAKIEACLQGQNLGQVEVIQTETSQGFGFFDDEPATESPKNQISQKPSPQPPPTNEKAKPEENKSDEPAKAPTSVTGQTEESIRVNLGRIDKLVRYIGELSTYNSVISQFRTDLASPTFQSAVDQLNKISKNIQDLALGLRMLPLKPTFQKMKRIVRDSAKALEKDVNFVLQGEEVEVDKTILEQLDGPLVHLIRNAIDHGLEASDERRTSGKKAIGEITLAAYHESGHLMIEIRDDGKGLNLDRLREKAYEKGFFPKGQVISDKEAQDLIFRSGFSTKPAVTDLSGRGVGMDVVKTNIDKLGGSITVESKVGYGSTFKITLPLTLSIIHGMVLISGKERYVVPLSQVNKMVQPHAVNLTYLTGIGEVFVLDGKTIPLIRLANILVTSKTKDQERKGVIVVLDVDNQKFGLFIDDVIGQQPVVIRKLGKELAGAKGFAGGAILGDGRAALILDVVSLYELHKRTRAA